MITIVKDGKTDFQIIYSTNSVDLIGAIREFSIDLEEKTGVAIPVYSETDKRPEKASEILFGRVLSRPASAAQYDSLAYTESRVDLVNGKLCVASYSRDQLKNLLSFIREHVVRVADGEWGIDAGYSYRKIESAIAPKLTRPEIDIAKLQGIYDCGMDDFEASYEKVTDEEYAAYLALLEENGYDLYDQNSIAGNLFHTFVKDDLQVNLCRYPSKKLLKIIFGVRDYLPALEPGSYEKLATPSVTQLGREGADESSPNGAPGMGYVVQLSDGRYVIVDGGPTNENDVNRLYQFLVDHKPASHAKPVIAMWAITHAHGDHTGVFTSFASKYRKDVKIEIFGFQFPNFDKVTITYENAAGMASEVSTCYTIARAYYKNAAIFKFHTGQRLVLADAVFDFIYTHEDFYPAVIPWGNHTSSVFRMTLGEKGDGNRWTTLFTGDAETSLCDFMVDVYGTWLKCDILQLNHHGYNGATLPFYKLIDPDICFWASDEWRFLNDKRCLGTQSGYEFNKWLRDDSVKKRAHYHSSADTTILLTPGNQ